MKDTRTASLVVNLILILLISSACQPPQPAAPAPTDAVPVAVAVQPTATKAPPTATTAPTETPAPTDTPEPTEIPALNPSPRGYVSMTYDSESDKIILFGGQLTGTMHGSDETWAYDVASNTWTKMKPDSGPPEKGAVDLVYDVESDRVILFGGNYGDKDTWAYDYNTNTWTEKSKGPGAHLGYRMAYDIESDRCILFGGYLMGVEFFDDTWVYDYNSDTWTKMNPSTRPAGRNYHAMAYDPQADRVILFGGGDFSKSMDDTWAYDYNSDTWTEMEPGEGPRPRPRSYLAMVYDTKAERVILFGGEAGMSETWSYDYASNTWTKLEPGKSPAASRHALAYSSAADRVILFGGQVGGQLDFTDRTASFDYNTTTWINVTRSP
jgi:hypothetical protein